MITFSLIRLGISGSISMSHCFSLFSCVLMKQQDICIEEYWGEKQWLNSLCTINLKKKTINPKISQTVSLKYIWWRNIQFKKNKKRVNPKYEKEVGFLNIS